MSVEFCVLGPVTMALGGVVAPISAAKQRAMLVALLLNANQTVSVDRLTTALWTEPPRSATANIRTYATGLRRALGPDGARRLIAAQSGYRLNVGDGELDLHRFETMLARGRAAQAEGDMATAALNLDSAVSLWRGHAAEDIQCGAELTARLAILDEERLRATEDFADAQLALGNHVDVIAKLRQLTAEHPHRERAWGQLMLALYRAGHATAALSAYSTARNALVDGLGIEPGAELRQLQASILRRDKELDAAALPTPPSDDKTPAAGPRQLPADTVTFVGRTGEFAELCAALGPEPVRGAPAAAAIHGFGGNGKSTLAIRVAHAMADQFPDGQLYVDLHGSHAGLDPLEPAEVLGRFLRALGVPGEAIPATVDEAAALYRSRTADMALLIVLDNAVDAGQLRPLLPANPRCGVLLTSRRMLSTLDGVTHLPLEALPEGDAVALLARTAGTERIAAETAAASTIARFCGHLPLALRIAGARLAGRPDRPLAWLVSRLSDERRRLDELHDDDLAVRTSFEVSYRALHGSDRPSDQLAARAFRLLGILRQPNVSTLIAASLLDVSIAQARLALGRLTDARLVESESADRFVMHDLLRLFANERAEREVSAAEREEATTRALATYLGTTRRAADAIRPKVTRTMGTEFVEAPDAEKLEFADGAAALEWMEVERLNLIAACRAVVAEPGPVARFPTRLLTVMHPYLPMRGYWGDMAELSRLSLDVAPRFDDTRAESMALVNLAWVEQRAGRLDEAQEHLERSLAIRLASGDRHNAASSLDHLGLLHERRRNPRQAIECFERARGWLREFGNQVGLGVNLTNSAKVYLQVGRYTDAFEALTESLAIGRAERDRMGVAEALVIQGLVLTQLGRYAEALDAVAPALEISLEVGAREYLWHGLVIRAVARHRAHHDSAAVADDLNRAQAICRDTDDKEGDLLVRRFRRQILAVPASDCSPPDEAPAGSIGGGLEILLDHVRPDRC